MVDEQDIESTKIRLTSKKYIKLGSLISLVLAMIGGIYAYVYKEIDTSKTIESLISGKESQEEIIETLKREVSQQSKELERLSRDAPNPYQPKRDTSMIIGDDFGPVELKWYESEQPEGAKYKIVLYAPDAKGMPDFIDVPRPEEKKVTIHREGFGIFFWKIGDEVHDRWSDYASFAVYQSTLDRVLATRKLVVGRTADFNPYDDGLIGFEDKLVSWIAEHLEDEFKIPHITVERKVMKWMELLKATQEGDVDISLANITSSKKRERDFFPLSFSVGYLPNHQLLVRKKGRDYQAFPDGLKGKVVGAHKGSINLKAAQAIAQQYGFTVYEKPRAYADSLEALENEEIDFAMIDMVRYVESESRLQAKVDCYGPKGKEFDAILKKFYQDELEQPHEVIAIAVHDSHPEAAKITLLKVINQLLSSEEGQLKLNKMKKKDFPNFRHPCE